MDARVCATTAPRSIRVHGRAAGRGNSDICGNYSLAGSIDGHPFYQQQGSNCMIYYLSSFRRWVINRSGNGATGMCLAYADSPAWMDHPASVLSLWYVYENSRGQHMPDQDVSVDVCDAGERS